MIARVASGELDESYRAEAEKYITEELTPQEIAEVYRKAQAGFFGDNATAIKDACKGFLPIAQQNDAVRQQQQAQAAQAQTIRAKSWETAFKAVPQLQDKASPQFKEFTEANAILTAQFPDLWNRPEAPLILMKFAESQSKAKKSETYEKELAVLRAENEALKKRQTNHNAPLDIGGGGSTTGKGKSPEERLAEGLREAGIG